MDFGGADHKGSTESEDKMPTDAELSQTGVTLLEGTINGTLDKYRNVRGIRGPLACEAITSAESRMMAHVVVKSVRQSIQGREMTCFD